VTDTAEVQRITADEAVAALTAAAWTEHIAEEKYQAAVEACLLLAGEPAEGTDPFIPASQIRAAVKGALGEQRTLIHCFMTFGCDWTLESAIALARRDDAQCAWAPSMFRHELAIWADGSMHRFEAHRPAPAVTEGEGK
jgi:hypothetical protein